MSKPTLLVTARSKRTSAQTKRIRRELFKAANSAVNDTQDDIRGFALLVWDSEGRPYIGVNTAAEGNLISTPMLPTYAFSQLQRFVLLNDHQRGVKVDDI